MSGSRPGGSHQEPPRDETRIEAAIERALVAGTFIRYGSIGKFVRGLTQRNLAARSNRHYPIALPHLQRARECYKASGQQSAGNDLIRELSQAHRRKSSLTPGLERLAAGCPRENDDPPSSSARSGGGPVEEPLPNSTSALGCAWR